MAICIPKPVVDKIAQDMRQGKFSFAILNDIKSSKKRRAFFEQYAGAEMAQEMNTQFEKALASRYKNARENWVWRTFYDRKPLYKGLAIAQSRKMVDDGITMKDFDKMTDDVRIQKLSEYTSEKTAIKLNDLYNKSKKSGNLKNWEEKTLGTKELFENERIKDALQKIKNVDDAGLLTPKAGEMFMEDLIKDKLGISLTQEQAKELSGLAKKANDKFDAIDDWTPDNRKDIVSFYVALKKLNNFVNKQSPAHPLDLFTDTIARGNLLLSFRSGFNSFVYQTFMTPEVVAREMAGLFFVPGDYSIPQKFKASFKTIKGIDWKYVFNNVGMGWEIYRKTDYDIARSQTAADGHSFFGEQFTHLQGKTFKESEGFGEKFIAIERGYAHIPKLGLKYAAGGSDALGANLHKAMTIDMYSGMRASLEESAGELQGGITREQRKQEIKLDASSFSPKTDAGKYTRDMGILHANIANGTQEGWGSFITKMRGKFKLGNFNIGKMMLPFAKIPGTVLGKGIESATFTGLIRAKKTYNQAVKEDNKVEKAKLFAEATGHVLATIGPWFGAIAIIAMFDIDDDDFIESFDYTKKSENGLTKARNAGASYIRIGNKWIDLAFLPVINIPMYGYLKARRNKQEGLSPIMGFATGVLSGVMTMPGIREIYSTIRNMMSAEKAQDYKDFLDSAKLDAKSLNKWALARMFPSFLYKDVFQDRILKEPQYDFMGREIPNPLIKFIVGSKIKQDTSNIITDEFLYLNKNGAMPMLNDPTEARAVKLINGLPEEVYEELLLEFKRDYAYRVEKLIDTDSYQKKTAKEKKKNIDNIRKDELKKMYDKGDIMVIAETKLEKELRKTQDEKTFMDKVNEFREMWGINQKRALAIILTKNDVEYIKGGLIKVERDYKGESASARSSRLRDEMGAYDSEDLDHILPLILGGLNNEFNLELLDEEIHKDFTKALSVLRRKVTSGEITNPRAVRLMRMYRKGETTLDFINGL